MLTLGDETFSIADAVLLGRDVEINGGWMTMRPTVVERRASWATCAYVTHDHPRVLIGVLGRRCRHA